MMLEKHSGAEAARSHLPEETSLLEAPAPGTPFPQASESLRIVIADDHPLMAQGLEKILSEDFNVVATVGDGRELLAAAERHHPDLVLADVCMPQLTGVEAARQLRGTEPSCKVILLSVHASAEFVREAFVAGASAYLLKSSASDELWDAIREVMGGRVYVSSSIARDVLASLLTSRAAALSPRQREILALVADGCSAKEVAGRLQIAVKTAQFHRNNIMAKLGVHTTAELTRYALSHGIVSD
jgi:DNA-binding NarL/FixJ family response regulator